MDKERIDGFRSAFAPGETLFWQVPAAARERMAFYSENLSRLFSEKITAVFAMSDHYALEFMRFLQGQGIRRLEALRDGTPCDAGILIAQFLGAEEHTEAFSYLPMAVSTVLFAWLRCKEHAAVPFWVSFGAVAANTGLN